MRLRVPLVPDIAATSVGKWAAFLVPELVRIGRYLRANDVACLNVHYPSLAALQLVLARALFRRRTKVILSFHGLDLAQASRARGLERRLWNVLLRHVDAVVSCSAAQTRAASAFEPAIHLRTATIHNGVDIAQLMRTRNPAARVAPRLRGRRFILTVASCEPKKGLDTLLHAFKAVCGQDGDILLALVGPDLGIERDLRDLAARIGVADRVAFCGEVPHADLHAYYTAARVFCLSSRAEPFGIVLLEAAAFRCPVVATSVGGVPEILTHDVNACLVPADDATALAAQLRRLLEDERTSGRLADALYRHVNEQFPWERARRSYEKLVGQPAPMQCDAAVVRP